MTKALEIKGQRHGRLVAVEKTAKKRGSNFYWRWRCDCGSEIDRVPNDVRSGRIVSCGCYRSEEQSKRVRTHGLSGSETYKIWQTMIQRCENPNEDRFERYGGRGIEVCERWKVFENFISDMGLKPSINMQIDRIDNDGHYEPDNCRWATPKQNVNNRSVTRYLTVDEETMSLSDWSERTGIKRQTIVTRLRRGWTVKEALTKEVKRNG